MELVELELARVIIQQKGDHQYIHLREKAGERTFPIVIGFHEVEEINRKLCRVEPPRPLTHDLVGRLIRTLGFRLQRVVITELREGTFFANLVLVPADAAPDHPQGERAVDCRPSDAIALAVQTNCRIFVARDVLEVVAQG
ncbi:MAG TPA: bifunctional nuclease family protein [Planctomycetota bacterium]|nr:bifunctional nuclease family protein [Planctomycetota bacterium]